MINKQLCIVGLVFTFSIGLYFGWFLAYEHPLPSKLGGSSPYEKGFDEGLEEAEARLVQKGILVQQPANITEFSASLIQANKNQITVKPSGDLYGPLETQPEELKIRLNEDDTVLMARIAKDPNAYAREIEDTIARLQKGEDVLMADAYTYEAISVDQLEPGDVLMIETMEPIKKGSTSTAAHISVLSKANQ